MSPRRRVPSAELIVRYANVLVAVGEAITARRKLKQMTQQELADLVEVERGYLSALEKGTRNPTLIMLTRIAEALDTTLEDLMRDAGV